MAKSGGEQRRPNPKQFRLSPEVLADLDFVAETLSRETGVPHTRTDAVRYSAKHTADQFRKRLKKEGQS